MTGSAVTGKINDHLAQQERYRARKGKTIGRSLGAKRERRLAAKQSFSAGIPAAV